MTAFKQISLLLVLNTTLLLILLISGTYDFLIHWFGTVFQASSLIVGHAATIAFILIGTCILNEVKHIASRRSFMISSLVFVVISVLVVFLFVLWIFRNGIEF